jgi:polyhydroxybutyrate depolymerase
MRTVNVAGRERSYRVHLPIGHAPVGPSPLVLAFHGGSSNAQQMEAFSGLSHKADQARFIVVYPNGSGLSPAALSWNGGNCCGYARDNNVDDAAFVRALLDDLAEAVPIDRQRIYATGMSNGGVLTYRLASELADCIAAVAPVAGPMGTPSCAPSRPVSLMHFHGTADEFAPFQGGKGPKSLADIEFFSVKHSISAWVTANGCSPESSVKELPDRTGDGTKVTVRTHGHGKDGAEVVLVEIAGAGHTWPGQEPRVAALGKSTRNISANDMMWEFFQKHPMQA